jgi:hypothetical protein
MNVHPRYHDETDARVKAVAPKAKLHAHGVWSRTVTVGGAQHATETYVHIYTTPTKDRYLVHTPASHGYHLSWETPESVSDILAETERIA